MNLFLFTADLYLYAGEICDILVVKWGDFMRILNFGSCNIDYVYSVHHIAAPGETIAASRLEVFCGGKGLNQSIAAARAEADIFHAGCIGFDGEMLREALITSGVDVSHLRPVDSRNGHAMIQVSATGENNIVLYTGSNGMISKAQIDEVLSHFTPDDVVLLQNEISNMQYVIEKAYAQGMRIVLNPAPFDESLKLIDLSKLSCMILNEVEAMGFTGKSEPEAVITQMRRKYPKLTVVLTLGKNGCVYADENGTLHQAAFQVEAVDTTGAGDTFIGYYLAELARGATAAKAIRIACAASAISVSRMGASPSIPTLPEVEAALPQMKIRSSDKQEQLHRSIESYLEDNLQCASLSGLAALLGYSAGYTGEVVKSTMGKSFSQLLEEMRCNRSAQLLRETDLTIDEIADLVGYRNKTFFREKFLNIYGMTPYQYKKARGNRDKEE